MNRALIDRVANAVLYEGYVLYPYRPSVKNRQRWTFGGLYPESYCRATAGSEASANRTECVVRGSGGAAVEVVVRFLHLTARRVDERTSASGKGEPSFEPVDSLRLGDRLFHTWQEAEEREVALGELRVDSLRDRPHVHEFAFPGGSSVEPIRDQAGATVGALTRERQSITGEVAVSATSVADGLSRLTVGVRNRTPLDTPTDRDDALLRTLVSAHVLLGVRGGEFVSLLDPPAECAGAVAACRNLGVWPVLVGEACATDAVLASPIILYDYPQVAPESPGDLFDGTEIDEILSLRILTLTDDEKRLAAAVDERARAVLARTESLGADDLFGLHGTIRGRRSPEESDG